MFPKIRIVESAIRVARICCEMLWSGHEQTDKGEVRVTRIGDFDQKIAELGGIEPLGPQSHPLSDDEVRKIEGLTKGKLPEDYREFIQHYGGCTFSDALVLIVCESGDCPDHLDQFFGGSEDASNSIVENIKLYKGRIQRSLMPIGEHWGNLVCLGVKGKDSGKVFYWDHETEESQLVSQDFASFFLRLKLDNEPLVLPEVEVDPDDPFAHLGGVFAAYGLPLQGAAEDDVRALEKQFDCRLPNDYRKFLLSYGGARGISFNDAVKFDSIDPLPASGEAVELRSFLGVDSISDAHDSFSDEIPNTHLFVGKLNNNRQVCLGIHGSIENKIVFWDVDTPEQVLVISNSFQELLNSLRPGD